MQKVNIFITEKYNALQKIEEEKSTKKSVTEEYGVKKYTISTRIANKRENFEADESTQVNLSWKKLKKSDNKIKMKLFLPCSKMHSQTTFLSMELSSRRKP